MLLLEQLEVEDDEVRKDIYRNALEIVVARTSDDF
ncbi:biofilm development regulator YmgB/AriR family protein [Rouxiella badensis]|nr:biofilm development regulator YmgB/AriR family protein [Rouxiella badensis]